MLHKSHIITIHIRVTHPSCCFTSPSVHCHLLAFEDPPEKLQQTCPTCPLLLPVDSQQAVDAAHVTLASYKRKSTLGAGLGVKKILRASAQVCVDVLLIWQTKLRADFMMLQSVESFVHCKIIFMINLWWFISNQHSAAFVFLCFRWEL